MSKHTPGMWTAIGNQVFVGVHTNEPKVIVQAKSQNAGEKIREAAANARLIAAAPEMLEALKYVLALSEGNSCLAVGMLVEHHSKIRQVIAKAEGESA